MEPRVIQRLFECAEERGVPYKCHKNCAPYLTCPNAEGRADDDGGREAFELEGGRTEETPVLARRADTDGGGTLKKAAGGADEARGGAGCVAYFHPTSAGAMAAKTPTRGKLKT